MNRTFMFGAIIIMPDDDMKIMKMKIEEVAK